MDKPDTVALKEHLHRIVSQETDTPVHIVRKVIENQFSTASKAFKEHNSIEIAGLGKFYFSQNKAEHRLKDFKKLRVNQMKTYAGAQDAGDVALTETMRKKLESVDGMIVFLKDKLDGFQEGIRGVEKYPAPRGVKKGSDHKNKSV